MYVWFTPTKLHDHIMTLYNHIMFVWFTPSKIYSHPKMVLFIPTRFVFKNICSHKQNFIHTMEFLYSHTPISDHTLQTWFTVFYSPAHSPMWTVPRVMVWRTTSPDHEDFGGLGSLEALVVVRLDVVPLPPRSSRRRWRVVSWADILLDVISGVESALREGS
jgi:hypothetical protein